jgi:hypothetical protein
LRFWLLKLGPPPPDQAMVLAGIRNTEAFSSLIRTSIKGD